MENIKILFIHHSTGANLINEGHLRKYLYSKDPSIELWDHSYNLYSFLPKLLSLFTYHTGLSDFKGKLTRTDYNIILSNNTPKEYAEIFARDTDDRTLKSILSYNIVAFKNCFPTSRIETDEKLHEFMNYYKSIFDSCGKYTNNKFILVTFPPLRKEKTTLECAARAKELVKWLQKEKKPSNVFVFDLFTLLSGDSGYLRTEYSRFLTSDSHPNNKANKEMAPEFGDFLIKLAH